MCQRPASTSASATRRAWETADVEGTLTVRAANTLYLYPDLDPEEQLADFEQRFTADSDLLRFDTVKIYLDGILDLGTALLTQPYFDPVEPDLPSGFRYFETDQLFEYVDALHAMGYRINFHVIGDGAVREALDAIEAIDDDPDAIADRRHRLTHAYMVHPDDVPRFAELGVIADFQQSPFTTAVGYHDFLAEYVNDTVYDLIPTRTLLDSGATVTMSSDWEADPLSPLGTIERSLTRATNAVPDLATAIELVTINQAYALDHDETTGSIEVGKFADFVVLESNLFDLAFADIGGVRVIPTYVAGEPVYVHPILAGR